jgi:hypothetical protein
MKISFKVIGCIGTLVSIVVVTQAQGWRGIVPLHSTRLDVERLIGPPMQNGITYDLKSERVTIGYSDGACAKGQSSEWNVPLNTVITITIYPQTKVMLVDLRGDLARFEKYVNPNDPEIISYKNDEEGIGISARLTGEVIVVRYFPPAKDRNMRCPHFSPDRLGMSEMQYYKFDQYSKLSLSDEKARLNNFAIELQKTKPDLKGYIIVYTGPRARSGEAKMRAERAKAHLVKARGIDPGRIVAIDGGCRARLQVELYAVPIAMSPVVTKSRCAK